MRLRPNARLFLFASVACLLLAHSSPAASPQSFPKVLWFQAADGQPSYQLTVSAAGDRGTIQVRATDVSRQPGALVQTLSCPLLEEGAQHTADELDAIRQQFLGRVGFQDLNLDGYSDLLAPREFGANWTRFCVWLYDPRSHQFIQGKLADDLASLSNLQVDAQRGWIIGSQISPTNPGRTVYHIEQQQKDVPGSGTLVKVQSCALQMDDGGQGVVAATATSYEGGESIQRIPLQNANVRDAIARCDALVPSTKP